MKSKPISEKAYRKILKPILDQVFWNHPLFGALPVSSFDKQAILFPVNFHLKENELNAVLTAMQTIGDQAFYISLIERYDEEQGYINDWYIPQNDYETYFNLEGYFKVLENVIYSKSGQWGIKLAMDQHAIVGGSNLFIDTLFNHLSKTLDEQTHDYLVDCKYYHEVYGHNISWLFNFLTTIYGQDLAKSFLHEAEVMDETSL
jgi:hypothetical protein